MIKEFELQIHSCLKGPKKFGILQKVRITDSYYQDLTANAHGTKKIVRIGEISNYRVFELTGVVERIAWRLHLE